MVQHAVQQPVVGVAQLLEAAVERLMDPADYASFLRGIFSGFASLIPRQFHWKEVVNQRRNHGSR